MKTTNLIITCLVLIFTGCSQTADEYLSSGKTKIQQGNHKEAIEDFTKALEIDPENADAYYHKGLVKYSLENYKEATEYLTKALEFDPYSGAYKLRGHARYFQEDYKGAVEDFTKAIVFEPEHEEAYYYRGLAKIELGKPESACSDLSKAAELGLDIADETISEYCR